jgi:hypothetical protein
VVSGVTGVNTTTPSYPSVSDSHEPSGPSPEFIWLRTERALGDSTDALHKIQIHERECALRFFEVRNELKQMRFWMKLASLSLIVLFLSVFLNLDAIQILKLITPAVSLH